jgi:TPR repeat protein
MSTRPLCDSRLYSAATVAVFALSFAVAACKQSPKSPFEEVRAKAEAGDAKAQYDLAVCYYAGQGVAKNEVEAVKWYRKAAEQNLAGAQFNLGVCYGLGEGVPKDEVEAVKWYRKAAEQNLAKAQFNLGVCYGFGQGVEKDDVEAVEWYRKAAEQNLAVAQFNLGNCYGLGEGVAKNEVEAVKWYRKAAEQNLAGAQFNLGICYHTGQGVKKNDVEAVKWYRKAAKQNLAKAQFNLGICYLFGQGVEKDDVEAVEWYRKAAEQNLAVAQFNLGVCYYSGEGVAKNEVEAVKWYRKAAEQNLAGAQYNLGVFYRLGEGVPKDEVEGYKWMLLAAAQGDKTAKKILAGSERRLTRQQITEGQELARNFKPRKLPSTGSASSDTDISQSRLQSSGTGFFITEDGYLVSNQHVVENRTEVRVATAAGMISAKVVKVDAANDLALLKAEGKFAALPIVSSRTMRLGGSVVTVGFPNIGLQGFAPKFARGEIGSLSGPQDDARFFQISVPVQPGNSGGALVDERGNVVGIVSAKLSAQAALSTSGQLPENVNYAVKSSFLLSFLESVPEIAAKVKEPNTKDMKSADVVERAKEAAVLVLVY